MSAAPVWRIGDRVIWPNGVEGAVLGIDLDDCLLLDDCGGWIDMADVDFIGEAFA